MHRYRYTDEAYEASPSIDVATKTWYTEPGWLTTTAARTSLPYGSNAIDLNHNKAILMRELERQARYDNDTAVPRVTVEEKKYRIGSKLIAESIGTALFVFIGILSALSRSPDITANVALAHGLAIAINVATFGHISGGHFNPAVTISVALAGRIKLLHCMAYIVAQLAGSVVGACLVRLVTLPSEYEFLVAGATILPESELWLRALTAETALTTFLTSVVLAVGVDIQHNPVAPFAIGLTIVAGVFSIKSLSGACMNPARSFGPATAALLFLEAERINSAKIWHTHYIFWLGPLLGSAISALLYRLFFARGRNRLLF